MGLPASESIPVKGIVHRHQITVGGLQLSSLTLYSPEAIIVPHKII